MAIAVKKIEFELKSICPLLMDRFYTESKAKTEKEYKKEAENKIYKDKKGNPSIGANAIKACIRVASSELGKRMDAKKHRQTVKAGIFFDQDFFPLNKKTPDLIREDLVTRGQGDKVTRVMTFRPQFDSWTIKGKMNLIGIEPNFVKQALELGGYKYGLYGYRPEFGRFIITKFKEVN